jgi:hypothetical protein
VVAEVADFGAVVAEVDFAVVAEEAVRFVEAGVVVPFGEVAVAAHSEEAAERSEAAVMEVASAEDTAATAGTAAGTAAMVVGAVDIGAASVLASAMAGLAIGLDTLMGIPPITDIPMIMAIRTVITDTIHMPTVDSQRTHRRLRIAPMLRPMAA